MLWILLLVGGFGAIVMLLFALLEMSSSFRNWYDVRGYAIKMVILIVVGLVGLFGLAGIGSLSYDEISQTDNWELASITDNSQISGKGSGGLFYVCVSIDTEEIYSFYYQVNDGGFKRGKVDADTATIYEKDDCTPHVVEYTTYTKNKMNSILRIVLAFGYGESSQKTYEIYTPTGTILRTFNLDSQ